MTISGTPTALMTGTTVATGLAAVEAATGINVPLFVWGALGGLWAFGFLDPMTFWRRLSSMAIAALVAGVTARPISLVLVAAAQHFFAWWPVAAEEKLIGIPVALIIGLLCHTVIGKKLIEITSRGADGVFK